MIKKVHLRPPKLSILGNDTLSLPAIMRQGRWKQVSTVMEYIEATQKFEEKAARKVLQKIFQNIDGVQSKQVVAGRT